MIVIADSNLFFSGLYKPGGTIAQILKNERNVQFVVPSYIFDEVSEHLDRLSQDTGKTKRELRIELKQLTEKIKVIPTKAIPKEHIDKAIEIVRDIDYYDAFFVALHFYTKHKIWTGDHILINGLKAKGYDICITTSELKKSLYKK